MRQLVKSGAAAQAAFCAAFFFLPLSKPLLFISLAAAFILFSMSDRLAAARVGWRTLPWVMPALILSALPWLSLIVHEGGMQRGREYLNLSYYWLFAFGTFLGASQLRIVPWIRAFVCGVFAVFCYVNLRFPGDVEVGAMHTALGNYILYSLLLAASIALLSILYRHEDRRALKIVYLLGIGLFFFGLVSGKGRSGLLALLFLLPMIAANIFGKISRGRALLICAVAVLATLMSPEVEIRINAAVNDLRLFQQDVTNTSLGYRFEMWETAVDVLRDDPLLGVGPAGFGTAWNAKPRPKEARVFVEPHNAFLFFGAAYGVVGLAALVWLYAALMVTGWRHRRSPEGSAVLAFAVLCVFGSLTNTMFMGTVSHAWLMLFIGLQGSLLRSSGKPESAS